MTRNRALLLALRIALVAAAVWFVVDRVDIADRTVTAADGSTRVDPGLASLVRGADARWIALAFGSYTLFALGGIIRWWWLMRALDLAVSFRAAFRLSYIGHFFNTVMPGATGGDVIKAVCVARALPERRAQAVTTVLVDRLLGLLAIIVLGGGIAVTRIGEGAFGAAAAFLLGLVAAGALLTAPLALKPLRRALRLDRVLRALPFQHALREVDVAIQLYRARPGAVAGIFAFTVAAQIFGVLDAWCLARGFGLEVALADLVVAIAVISVFAAIPIAPGGWGIGEGLYAHFFRYIGVAAAPAVAISVITRLIATAHGLLGGLFLLRAPADVRAARDEAVAAQ